MTVLQWFRLVNSVLVLIYGLFLSALIAGGWHGPQQRRRVILLCPVLLLVQGILWHFLGDVAVRRLYPLITHLPLVLALWRLLKKPAGVAVVSVTIGYLCCQLPRWVDLAVTAVSGSALAGAVCYTLSIAPIFVLLRRWFVRPAYSAMTDQPRSLLLFGSLPAVYYVFDYATSVYADVLQLDNQAMTEFLPTAMIAFYVVFLTAYHVQAQARANAQLHSSMLDAELKQARSEMDNLHRAQSQTAIYQHDMRHHLTMVERCLAVGKPEQAADYVRQVLSQVEQLTVRRYCENETVNLLCSAFADRAARMNVQLKVEVRLPESIPVTDTELCAVLSNGLENALHAVDGLEADRRWVRLYCEKKRGKLLLEIRNPYDGQVELRDGLPVSQQEGHGYGCRSIAAIAEHYRGLYTFEAENGIFTLRVVLPILDGAQ